MFKKPLWQNSVDPDQTAPIGAVCSGSTLFASILNSLVMLDNYLQQTTSADDIFRCIFFLALQGLNIKMQNTNYCQIFICSMMGKGAFLLAVCRFLTGMCFSDTPYC